MVRIIVLFADICGSWEAAISNANGQGEADQQFITNGKFWCTKKM